MSRSITFSWPIFERSRMGGSFSRQESYVRGYSATRKGQVIELHSSAKWKVHFEASKETNKLMVIDFSASWCGPCKRMEPYLRDFAAEYTEVTFVKIDVDELPDVSGEFGVQAMPTFVLIKGGKVVDKIVGANVQDLQKKIEKHRAQLETAA